LCNLPDNHLSKYDSELTSITGGEADEVSQNFFRLRKKEGGFRDARHCQLCFISRQTNWGGDGEERKENPFLWVRLNRRTNNRSREENSGQESQELQKGVATIFRGKPLGNASHRACQRERKQGTTHANMSSSIYAGKPT